MTVRDIEAAWRSQFGQFGPAAFLSRQAAPDRWIRIHSLPDSKRYPETDADRDEILCRHLAVAESVIGDTECILFVTRFGPSIDPARASLSDLGGLPFLHLDDLSISEEDEDDSIQFFAAPFIASPSNLRPLILAVANDTTGSVLLANFHRASAYAPYDGGADLFFPSSNQASAAADRWQSWLSSRQDRL